MGEPRIQGGPGSTVRPAFGPKALPRRNALASDGKGARIAVLDTGMFEHEWLSNVVRAPYADDVWDVENDGYGDNESGHGTFIAGLIQQVAPAASVYAVKVLDSHGVGDDLKVAEAMALLPANVNIVNLSLGGYTDGDQPPMAIALAMQSQAFNSRVVVAAAGNHAEKRPFWPAAFGPVVSVGAVEDKEGLWAPASYSNHGAWVDLVARGSNLQSTFAHETTKVAQGPVAEPVRSVRQLRRLGRMGRHLVLHADRRRDDRPHDDPHRDLLRAGRRVQAHAELAERRAGGLPEREAGRRTALTPTTHALMIGAC